MMLLEYYRAIESSSQRMLEAARTNDFDAMMRYESVCAVLIEQLRECARSEDISQEQRVEKTQIMQRILRNDAEIRNLTEPWIDYLADPEVTGRRVLH